MKYFFSILLFLSSVSSFSQQDLLSYSDEKEQWIFSYLPGELFLKLPKKSQIEYIRLARAFLIQQEMRKADGFTTGHSLDNSDPTSRFSLFNTFLLNSAMAAADSQLTFPDANGRCNYVTDNSTLSKSLQDIVRKGRDQCVVAGQTVCMVILEKDPAQKRENTRLVCKLERMPAVLKELQCNKENPNLLACGGLFFGKDGVRPCVERKVGTTKACEKASAPLEEMIEYLHANPHELENFEMEFEKIRKYCGKRDRMNSFDQTDCEILNDRLRQLEKGIPDGEKTIMAADCTLKTREDAPKTTSDLRFEFRQKGTEKFRVLASGSDLKKWQVPDGVGNLHAQDSEMIENASKTLILSRWSGQNEFVESLQPNFSEKKVRQDCKAVMTYSQKYQGKIAGNHCVIDLVKRGGGMEEFKIPLKDNFERDRFDTKNYSWVPEEFPQFPDLRGSPVGAKVNHVSSGGVSNGRCRITLRWDLDAEPTTKKGKGRVKPKAEKIIK